MTSTISINEISKTIDLAQKYDYIEIEDNSSHNLKGLFISPSLVKEVKNFLDKKIKEKEKKELLKYVGIVDGEFKDLDYKEIKKMKV